VHHKLRVMGTEGGRGGRRVVGGVREYEKGVKKKYCNVRTQKGGKEAVVV